MAVTLLRHTTPDVAPGTCYGVTDLALADGFEAEAEAALAALPEVRLVVSSPLQRCRLLAEKAGRIFGHEVQLSDHWKEMNFGAWEGTAWEALPRAGLDAWAADFHGYASHGGESVAQLAARVRMGLEGLPDGALVVTHAGCIKAAAAQFGLAKGWDTSVPFGGTLRIPS